jgi:serine/threonine protein kinase
MTRLPNEVVDRLREVATRPGLPAGRYVIRRPIGRGGMGAVYAAYDAVLDREVAIKVSNAIAPATGLDARLRAEAQVLARLEHPGIVPVHDAGVQDDGRIFYVMKLVRGDTLADHLPTLAGEARKLAIFERVVDTVAFAHSAGIVHRDLTPANVMIGSFGEVLVLDWGVAKIMGTPAATGVRIGTPGFMAPEQEGGDTADVGPRADVFALGALAVWMFAGDSLSKRLKAIVAKCQAISPADRYADAAGLSADLQRYRDGLSVSAYRETWLDGAARWFARYRTFILLVLSYLVMRTAFAFWR